MPSDLPLPRRTRPPASLAGCLASDVTDGSTTDAAARTTGATMTPPVYLHLYYLEHDGVTHQVELVVDGEVALR
ncbi:hypothetical protein [Halorubellus sp. PRR65]|uniref:hypothetical protein n=1 Tax=Halorubellus sp. PRR65 TaxID=3098148 RepID=UPI002B26129F|nr:hypothetical protein [Halorubellus sp. PRR65]